MQDYYYIDFFVKENDWTVLRAIILNNGELIRFKKKIFFNLDIKMKRNIVDLEI